MQAYFIYLHMKPMMNYDSGIRARSRNSLRLYKTFTELWLVEKNSLLLFMAEALRSCEV